MDKNFDKSLSDAGSSRSYHKGHRERLRKRFREGGSEALPDYELLELILFRAIQRRDTKPIAKALLDKFKTFAEVVNAPEYLLREIPGVGAAVAWELALIKAAAVRLRKNEIQNRNALSSWDEVLDYCTTIMGYETREQFRIIFLDKRNRIIADERQQQGTVDHTPVYVREIIKRALELSSTALILVHNHPSGDPNPSKPDIAMTRKIVEAAKNLSIVIHDHVIIGKEGAFSFRANGLI